MLRVRTFSLIFTLGLLPALAGGCSDDPQGAAPAPQPSASASVICGPGTIEQAGVCLPVPQAGSGGASSGKGGTAGAAGEGGEGGGLPTGICGEGTILQDGVCVLDPEAGGAAGEGGEGGTAGASGTAGQAGVGGAAGSAGGPTNCIPAQGGSAGASGGSEPFGGSGGDPFGGGNPFGGGGDPFGGGGSNQAGSGGSGLPICPACDSATVDCDGDGWMVKDGDCCDQPGPCGQTPELQNPGAVEYQGDGVDNDCDGFFDENDKACDAALGSSPNDALEYLKALDLCQFTKENVPLAQRKWGVISAEFTTAGGEAFPNPKQRSIRPKFGDNILPLRGESLLVLSSGIAADVYSNAKTPPAWELEPGFTNVSNSMGTSSSFPQDWLQANNNTLPTGCTDSGFSDTDANDSVMLKVRMRVPTNANSFSLQSLFMSAEFPEFICSNFNDLFLVLVKTEGDKQPLSPNPPDGNVAFLRTGSGTNVKKFPVGINLAGNATAQKLFAACDPQKISCSTSPVDIECALGPDTLAGTGYDKDSFSECTIGGATDWLTVAGNVVPGGIVELRMLIADVGDNAFDSTVLLDNFRWNATPGTPGGSELAEKLQNLWARCGPCGTQIREPRVVAQPSPSLDPDLSLRGVCLCSGWPGDTATLGWARRAFRPAPPAQPTDSAGLL
jgi:hypothetical protein